MRIFGLEVSKAPPKEEHSLLWNPSFYYENGRRINDMAPYELRAELIRIRAFLETYGKVTLSINPTDAYQRIRVNFK